MLNLNILKSREDISPLLPVVYLFYLFSWWKDSLCLWSRWSVLLKESAKSYERLWYKFGKKKALSWSPTYPQQSLCLVSERTGLRLGKVQRITTLRSEIMSGKMQFTGSLLRIISSVQFLGKLENSFGYIWFLYIVITYKTWS